MRAAYYNRYGSTDVLEIGELPDPELRPDQILVRVHAAGLNPKDIVIRKGKAALFAGSRFPKLPGMDYAGEVVALGARVAGIAVGDKVFGMVNAVNGRTCAELVAVDHKEWAPMPESLSYVEAAAVPLAALTALQALVDLATLEPGEQVCINGASGGVGVFALQIAKILGAHVVAVCSSWNIDFVSELGADEVLPYDRVDLLESGRKFPVFFDVFGNRDFQQVRNLLTERARYVTTIPRPRTLWRDLSTRFNAQSARLVLVRCKHKDLHTLTGWIQDGRMRSVVDRVLPLEESAAAHAYIETKRARGKVVLTLS